MEKIIEKDVMDYVFEVIDKHIKYHRNWIRGNPNFLEVNDSICAITSLEMLKRELKGEVEY